ncbi:MAG: hypothetical protein ABIG55_06660 [Candidatus Omnitrophota bacterium]|nr:hypothetical protein [Candidatus Omnitrophota bacterium]
MESSVFIAKLLGPFLLVVGLGMLLSRKAYDSIIKDFLVSPALMYIGGIMALIVGILVVLKNNIWVMDWRLIITITGWGSLLKGALLLVFPGVMVKAGKAWEGKTGLMAGYAVLIAGFGVLLILKTYF